MPRAPTRSAAPWRVLPSGRLGLDCPPGVAGAARRCLRQMREELVLRNVGAHVRAPRPRSKKMPVWTGYEARRFLESARADVDPMHASTSCFSHSACVAGSC